MVRIAIQVRELISSNVTSALDSASNPAKLLARLQREIEEAMIGLHGDFTRTRRQKERLETAVENAKAQEGDWGDKAKVAMDHGREDLARQALLARENCRKTVSRAEAEIAQLSSELTEIEDAERQLEAKREEVRQRHADQLAADRNAADCSTATKSSSSRTERRMDHIEKLEKRTAFATDETAEAAGDAGIEREIEALQRESKIEAELAALRESAKKKPAKKGGKRTKAA